MDVYLYGDTAAYIPMVGLGLMGVNLADINAYPGQYLHYTPLTVDAVRDTLLMGDMHQLFLLSPDLSRELAVLDIPAQQVCGIGGFPVPNSERRPDLAFAAGKDRRLYIADITDPRSPGIVSAIEFPEPLRSVRIDPYRHLACVSSWNAVYLADISDPYEGAAMIDTDGDGADDRILGRVKDLPGAGQVVLGADGIGYVADTRHHQVHTFQMRPLGRISGGPDDLLVFADEPRVEVYLYLTGGGTGDAGDTGKNVTVSWSVQGPSGGVLQETVQTSADGIFLNTFTAGRTAGDEFYLKAEITASEDVRYPVGTSARLGPYTVIPGPPAEITLSTTTVRVPADGASQASVTAYVKDAWGNPAADGTPLSLALIGDTEARVNTYAPETIKGVAQVSLPLGTVVGTRTFELSASETAVATLDVETVDIGLTVEPMEAVLAAGSGDTVILTASVTDAADGTPVRWLSTLGPLTGDAVIRSGRAEAVLTAAATPGDGHVYVSVAGRTRIVSVTHTGEAGMSRLSYPAIVGDETQPGAVTVDQWQGEQAYSYVTATDLEVYGNPGDTVRVALGTPVNPNAEPIAWFPFSYITDGLTQAVDGVHTAAALGSVAPAEQEAALTLAPGAALLLQDAADLAIPDDLFVGIDFKPDRLDTAGWPEAGPELKQGPALVRKGSDGSLSWRLGLAELDGQVRVEAVVQTGAGVYSAVHSLPVAAGKWHRAGFRFKDGFLEVEVDDFGPAAPVIVRTRAEGALQNTAASISVGGDFTGAVKSLRIGVESADRVLTRFADGGGVADVVIGGSGSAAVPVESTGRLSDGALLTVGISRGSGTVTGAYDLQPVRFARSGIAARLLELLGPDTAHAEWGWVTSHPRSSGVTLAGKRVFGWAAGLVDKVSAFAADHGMDIIKGAGELLSMAVGLDDFIILTKAMAALAAGATDEIETVEVCFAAAGAILTIAEVASLGTLAPAAESLKWGLDGFKLALKGMGPDGVKAALGMAKGLWKVIKEVATDRRAALVLVKDTSAAIVQLARNVGEPVFDVFVAVIRSPMDFMDWIQALRFFRRGAGCLLTFDFEGYERDVMLASSKSEDRCRAVVIFDAVMGFLAPDAYAGTPPTCMGATEFIEAIMKIDDQVSTTDAVREFIHGIVRIEREVVSEFGLNMLKLDASALDGMVAMLKHEKNGNHIFYIAKSVAENTKNLPPDETEAIIGKFFRLIGEIEDTPETTNRIWASLGKLMGTPGKWNDGCITGAFHQLEVMSELREAGKTVTGLEVSLSKAKGYTTQRYPDIIVEVGEGGQKIRFEVKNFTNYSDNNIERVWKEMKADLVNAFAVGETDHNIVIEEIKNTHFLFRGSPADDPEGAMRMMKELHEQGLEVLESMKEKFDSDDYKAIKDHFDNQMKAAKKAVEENITLKKKIPPLPDEGQLISFQGKGTPYGKIQE